MPQNKRSLKRHKRSYVPWNEARCVVSSGATGRKRSTVGERTCRSDHAFATTHGLCDCVLAFLRLRVQFDTHGFGVDVIKKDLNVK